MGSVGGSISINDTRFVFSQTEDVFSFMNVYDCCHWVSFAQLFHFFNATLTLFGMSLL